MSARNARALKVTITDPGRGGRGTSDDDSQPAWGGGGFVTTAAWAHSALLNRIIRMVDVLLRHATCRMQPPYLRLMLLSPLPEPAL